MHYYMERALQGLFTLFAVVTISFVLTRWMPGGPIDYLRAQVLTGGVSAGGDVTINADTDRAEQVARTAKYYLNVNTNEPIYVQYIDYMTSVAQGNFGRSITEQAPVAQIVFKALPWTLFIGSLSVFISFVSRTLLGAFMAYMDGTNIDFGLTGLMVWIQALPYYIFGILLLYVIGFQLQWLPTNGTINPEATPGLNYPFIAGVLAHAALPVLSLVWAALGTEALEMRGNSIQVLGSDYLRVARLRGVGLQRLTLLYVARNAILPMYTGLVISIGAMFSGTVLIESIFSYQGLGFILFRSIAARDYPLMMGGFILISTTIVISLIVADLTYGIVDPRVTRGGSDESF